MARDPLALDGISMTASPPEVRRDGAGTAQPRSLDIASRDGPRTLRAAVRRFYRHASPRFLTAVVLIALLVRVARGGWTLWDAIVALGIVAFWPVLEWLIHVFLLHARPHSFRGRTIDFAVPRKHRAHHRDPWNLEILFIPIQGFIVSIPVLLLLALGLLPTPELGWTAVTVFLGLGLRYEWIHFLVHTPYRPRTRHYERLWRNHRLHHCKNEHYWYGVTMLSGDRIFRTAPSFRDVPTSPTCRALEDSEGRAHP
jgi:hypothetical protein